MLVTSAVTGTGIDELRRCWPGRCPRGGPRSARISADVDDIAARFAARTPGSGPARHRPGRAGRGRSAAAGGLRGRAERRPGPGDCSEQLVEAFCRAAGVAAVGEPWQRARAAGVDYVGWPVAWLAERMPPAATRPARSGSAGCGRS